jgi:hypothetical protein
LGLRTVSPENSETNLSKANSVRSQNEKKQNIVNAPGRKDSGDSDTQAVRSHGPNGEERVHEPASARASTDASGSGSSPTASATHPMLSSQTDGAGSTTIDLGSRENTAGSHKSGGAIEAIKYHISGAASTNELPDGRPESEMKTMKEHALGHLSKKKHG